MKVSREGNTIIVTAQRGDKPPKDESHFWYKLRNAFRAKGEDVIKKEMWKDGHLVSDHVFYVRTRKIGRPGAWGVYDNRYALRDVAADYRNEGQVRLLVADLSE